MSEEDAPRKRFHWVKMPSGVWRLRPEGGTILEDIAHVQHERGRQWRATLMWPREWWVIAGSPAHGRRLLEDYLSRKCWEWDDCELVEVLT